MDRNCPTRGANLEVMKIKRQTSPHSRLTSTAADAPESWGQIITGSGLLLASLFLLWAGL